MSGLFMKFSFIHPFRFRGDNARVMQKNFHESQYDGWSSRMPTILSIYAKHVGSILRLLNCTELLRVNQAKELVAVCV